jgi:hypothetical protein
VVVFGGGFYLGLFGFLGLFCVFGFPFIGVCHVPILLNFCSFYEPELPLEAHLSLFATLTLRALLPLREPSPRDSADL